VPVAGDAPTDLGARLKGLRSARGLSLRQVEEQTEISSGHLSLIETGRVKNPSPTVLHRLAKAYGASPEDLLVLAGYLRPKNEQARQRAVQGIAMAELRDLNEDEMRQISTFIQVLRANRKRKEP
jgi:HTH-type transcriptional regulator, competence development regulator